MLHHTLEGTHYEMGLQLGASLAQGGRLLLDQVPFPITEERRAFARACLPLYRTWFPAALEELAGLAEGQGCSKDMLVGVVLSMYAMPPGVFCSCFALRNRRGVLFGRNSDFLPALEAFNSNLLLHFTEGGLPFLGNTTSFLQMEDGVNEAGLAVSTEDVDYVAKQLGLGEPTGVELPENTGMRANAETKAAVYAGSGMEAWVDGDKLQASIGQSLNAFTPLQMACYTAALANQGTRYKATFLSRVVSWDYQDLIAESEPEILSQLKMSDEAIACVSEGMQMTVSDYSGTAFSYLNDYPIPLAAKTGTAQHGSGGSDNASFICYAPADDPQIAIAVYVEHGAQGGNLANVVRPILDAYFSQESKYETTYSENTVQ